MLYQTSYQVKLYQIQPQVIHISQGDFNSILHWFALILIPESYLLATEGEWNNEN